MKIRTDFVTNSSSSSFIIAHRPGSVIENILKLLSKEYSDIEYDGLTQERCSWLEEYDQNEVYNYSKNGYKIDEVEFPDYYEELIEILHNLQYELHDYHIISENNI